MPKLPRISGKELARILHHQGYTLDRVSGSHHIYCCEGKHTVVVPIHGNRDLSIGTLKGIVKYQLEMTIEEFSKHVENKGKKKN